MAPDSVDDLFLWGDDFEEIFEEFTADHRVPGLIGFTADYIV